jgi:hypothetical protein
MLRLLLATYLVSPVIVPLVERAVIFVEIQIGEYKSRQLSKRVAELKKKCEEMRQREYERDGWRSYDPPLPPS